jgi:hypothetical protein
MIPINATVENQDGPFNLTADSDEEGDCGTTRGGESDKATELHGCFVKNAVDRAIRPQLTLPEEKHPGTLEHWKKHGVDIVVVADEIAEVVESPANWRSTQQRSWMRWVMRCQSNRLIF